jgi:hypothetical protein
LNNSIRKHFPEAQFRPPATVDEILWVEQQLRIHLPEYLRRMYLAFDGFRAPKGNASYLLPLTEDEGAGSLVATNLFFRDNFSNIYPHLNLRRFVFFGVSGPDKYWATSLAEPSEIIHYDLDVGSEYNVAGSDILQVYLSDQQRYG